VQDFSGLTMKWKPKRRASLMLAIVFCLTAVISHAQNGWTAARVSSGGKDLNAVYFADAKRGWVGGDNGFFSYTEDGGAHWAERPLGIDHGVNDIYFVSKETGFVLAGGSIFETNDGGHSWREAHKFLPSEFDGATPELYSLRFSGKKRGWVVGSASRGDVITNSILAVTEMGASPGNYFRRPLGRNLFILILSTKSAAGLLERPAPSCTPTMRVRRGSGSHQRLR